MAHEQVPVVEGQRRQAVLARRRFLGAMALVAGGAGLSTLGCAAGAPIDRRPPDTDPASTTETNTESAYFPTDIWETVAAADAGWDDAGLDRVVAFADAHGTKSLLLLTGGRIVVEHRIDGDSTDRQEVASCQKSVVALLVGVAVERSLLSLDDPVTAHLGPGWSAADAEPEGLVTIRHLLSMTSGLDSLLRAVAAPGEVWSYNTNAYQKLRPVLEAAAGTPVDEISSEWLWRPIGATSSAWYERRGTDPLAPDGSGSSLWGLVMSARDMARFGLLVERAGTFADTRVVERSVFLDQALRSSSTSNPSYGYLWWLNGQDGFRLGPAGELQPGPLIPAAPSDLVAALGKDDQKIYVSRSEQIVLVRQGESAGPRRLETMSSFDNELWTHVMAARLR
jgi:CubicO group peptidase (beta-lactamase class C family)